MLFGALASFQSSLGFAAQGPPKCMATETDRPVHDLLFGRDPGEEVPTRTHARELLASLPHQFERVASLLRRADAILVGTGAGWSADSKLATYKDVADVPALRKAGLSYYDLCQTHWLRDDPSAYYGFWGYCLHSYRQATPHEGYRIVRKWSDNLGNRTDRFRGIFDSAKLNPVFIYSSNVDGHWHWDDLFLRESVFEFHGTCEDWCCSGSAAEGPMAPCSQQIWSAPSEFQFEIDEATMRAEASGEAMRIEANELDSFCPFMLAQRRGDTNRPRCPWCSSLLRPRVLHFGDGNFFEREGERASFERWSECIFDCMTLCNAPIGDDEKDEAKHVLASALGERAFCLAVLEFGCGLNVPTIRRECEKLLDMYPENCVLVRVNPDFPLVLDKEPRQRIEVMTRALAAVRAVDAILSGRTGSAEVEEKPSPSSRPSKPKSKPKPKSRTQSGSRASKG